MRRNLAWLLIFVIGIFNSSFAQGVVEKGHEVVSGEMNFMELAGYYALHPQPLMQKAVENEDDDERPERNWSVDLGLKHFRAHTSAGSGSPSMPLALMPVSPGPTDSFEASKDTGTSIPPDTHGAVDSNYCVTALNQCVRIQTRAGGMVSTVLLDHFWASVLPGGGSFDPRVHYDVTTHRWYLIAVSGAQSAQSSILLAISKTSNPTGGWWEFKVATYAPGTYWLDYPDVGFNNKWITVTGNLFANSGSGYLGAKVFVFNKALLLAGTSATYTAFTEAMSFTICPAITLDTTQSSLFAIESWDGTAAGGGLMKLWKVVGPVGSESFDSVGYPVATGFNWQGQSFAVSGTGGADFAPQVGSANLIQTNDDRITQVMFMNNNLWFSHNVFLPYSTTINPDRCSAQWWQLDTLGNPLQLGLLDDPTGNNFYVFPTLVVNTSNDFLMGFTQFSPTTHPNAAYALHMHTDPADSVETPFVYRHGQSTYYKTYSGTRDRWGDYSGAALDPLNMTNFWTIQECTASATNTYDTWWAYLNICSALSAPVAGVSPSTQCQGTTAWYSVGAVPGASSYTWSVAGTGWSGTSATDSLSLTAGSGVATVSVVANSVCTSSTAFVMTLNPLPLPALPILTPPALTPCSATTANYTATSTGALSYGWSTTGTGWSGTSTTASFTATVGSAAGQVIVYGVNTCGNGPADTLNVTPVQIPPVPVLTTLSPVPCESSAVPVNYTATSAGATSFSWIVAGTGWSGTSATGTINVTVGTGTGLVICQGTNYCGTSAYDTVSITPLLLPGAPALSLVGSIPCVTATAAQYAGSSSDATGYSWTVLGTGWGGTGTTDTVNLTVGSGTGTIICSGINGCGNGPADTAYLTPSSGIGAASAIMSTTGICEGSTATFITSAISGATSYNWTLSGPGWSGSSSTTLLSCTVGTGPAIVSVYGSGPCGDGSSYTLYDVVPVVPPTASFSLSNHVLMVGAYDNLTYTGSASSAGAYSWNFGGGATLPSSGMGPFTISWSTPGLKTITLSVTDSGCSSLAVFSDTVLVVNTTGLAGGLSQDQTIALVPNPNAGSFDVVFGAPVFGPVNVRITDMKGAVCYRNAVNLQAGQRLLVNDQLLSEGMYIMTIITGDNVANLKLVIRR